MRGYLTLFSMKLRAGLQYRGAAISGMVTQLIWGFLLITFYQHFSNSSLSVQDLATYLWMNQAFISLNAMWTMDPSLFEDIETGNIQYSLIRPQNIYIQWLVRNGSHRLARTLLRATPILLIVFLLPKPYTMSLPTSPFYFIGFILSLTLSFITTLIIGNIMVALTMKTKQGMGVRILFTSIMDFLDGGNIPYSYFPKGIQTFLSLSFFYSIKTAPFLLYLGKLPIITTLLFQLVWIIVLGILSYALVNKELKKLEVFGG